MMDKIEFKTDSVYCLKLPNGCFGMYISGEFPEHAELTKGELTRFIACLNEVLKDE